MIAETIVVGCLLSTLAAILSFRHASKTLLIEKQQLLDKVIQLSKDISSIRVRHGQVFERFVPMMPELEKTIGSRDHFVHLGMPIDYIYFGDDCIKFIEVKTGNSQLSSKQQRIQHLVKQKKIEWIEVYDESGSHGRRTREWKEHVLEVPSQVEPGVPSGQQG